MEIRDALPSDAEAACAVMRRSIAELCMADHHDDPKILGAWLANKTAETFRSWLARGGQSYLLALLDGRIVAVGAVTDAGEITLNYVSPDARFQGVSRAMLAALERRAAERGNQTCTLLSTATALRFYLARGYVQIGEADRKYGTSSGFPMMKALG
ncbi:MAG TPA: GNAT family N-acetyltransferase [Reyranella sp.]|nr:GNAT family N-acetyltransferase [Reyranella sp.]